MLHVMDITREGINNKNTDGEVAAATGAASSSSTEDATTIMAVTETAKHNNTKKDDATIEDEDGNQKPAAPGKRKKKQKKSGAAVCHNTTTTSEEDGGGGGEGEHQQEEEGIRTTTGPIRTTTTTTATKFYGVRKKCCPSSADDGVVVAVVKSALFTDRNDFSDYIDGKSNIEYEEFQHAFRAMNYILMDNSTNTNDKNNNNNKNKTTTAPLATTSVFDALDEEESSDNDDDDDDETTVTAMIQDSNSWGTASSSSSSSLSCSPPSNKKSDSKVTATTTRKQTTAKKGKEQQPVQQQKTTTTTTTKKKSPVYPPSDHEEYDAIFHTTKLGLELTTEGGTKGDAVVVVSKVSNEEYKNIIHPNDTILSIGTMRLSTSTTLLKDVLSLIVASKRPLLIRFSRKRSRKRHASTGSAATTPTPTTMNSHRHQEQALFVSHHHHQQQQQQQQPYHYVPIPVVPRHTAMININGTYLPIVSPAVSSTVAGRKVPATATATATTTPAAATATTTTTVAAATATTAGKRKNETIKTRGTRDWGWENNYTKMQAYKEQNGDLKMTRKCPGYEKKLIEWCWTQRTSLRKYEDPTVTSSLTADRAKRLKELGFTASAPRAVVGLPATMQQLFEAKLKELEDKETTTTTTSSTSDTSTSNDDANNGGNSTSPTQTEKDDDDDDEGQEAFPTAAVAATNIQKRDDTNGEEDTNEDNKKEKSKDKDLTVWSKRRIAMWECNLLLMEQYQERHGTCKLEKNKEGFSLQLKSWCQAQRMQMKHFLHERDRCNLDAEKYELLKGLGLLQAQLASSSEPTQEWETMYEALTAYKVAHGNVLVPDRPRSPLRTWIVYNREHYKKMKASDATSQMTVDRLQRLQELGLELTVEERKGFNARAAEWLEYQTKHGKKPPMGDSSLGRWIQKIRHKYREQENGIENNLTQEQIEKLTSWNFTWSSGVKIPAYKAPIKSWEARFQELLDYKSQHGHVKVPQVYPVLGSWVHRQRREVSSLKRGLPTRITSAQIEKLKSVGFIFLTRKSPLDNERKRKELEFGVVAPSEHSKKRRMKYDPNDDDDDGSSNDDEDEDKEEPARHQVAYDNREYRFL